MSLVLVVAVFAGGRAWAERASAPAGSEPRASSRSEQEAPFDVQSVIRKVHFSYRREQDGWHGGHSTYEVKATAEGLTLTPVRFKSPEPEVQPASGLAPSTPPEPTEGVELGAPLFLGTARVVRGETRLSVDRPRGQIEADGHLAFAHGALVEHLRNSEQGVEQSWSFDAQPSGHGDLRVTIPVKGLVHTGTSEQGLHFADARTGLGFRYGHGTWVDGAGRRTAVRAEYVDGQIQLRVPEQVLAHSAYPAVLDPVVSYEMIIDGRLVTADLSARSSPALAFNGTSYLVVWRNARGSQYNIYGTRVSSTGTVLDPSGLVLGGGPGNSADPQVSSNGADFYVVWTQLFASDWAIRGTTVSSAGVVANPGGKRLSTATGTQYGPHVASLGGGYLVVWYMYAADGYYDVYARRVTSTGELPDSADIPIATGQNYDESAASVASNGTVYLVAWNDSRGGSSRAYATRVSSAGVVLDPGFPLSSSSLQYMQAVASNGTDFLAVWLDYRNSGTRDLYGTRVTGSGTVVDGTGLVISSTPSISESYASVASDGTDYLVAWTAWNTSGSTYQNLCGRVSSSAPTASAVVDTASLVLSPSATFKHPAVARSTSGYLVVWDGTSSGVTDLYDAWVSSSGTVSSGSGFPLTAVSSLMQTEPAVASNGSNYLVVWTETSGGTISIYGTRVTREGGVLDMPGLQLTSALRERQSPAVTSNGTDYFVTWMDYRNTDWDIYGARVLGSGASSSAILDPDGIAISMITGTQNAPAVGSSGSDYLVVWRQDVGGRADIYGARVSSAGAVLDPDGIAIATNPLEHYTPHVAFNGTHYLVVWAEYLSSTSWDIHGLRMGTDGAQVDSTPIVITSANLEQYDPDVASNGSDFFVVWTDGRSGTNTDIYGARVSGAGEVLDPSGLALCMETVQESSPKVVFDGTNYVSAWADYRFDTMWDVYATQVTSAGTVVTPGGFSVVYNARETEPAVSLASAGGQQSLAVVSHYDTEPNQGSRRVRGTFLLF